MVAVTQDLIDISLADAVTGWSGTSGQLDTEVYKQAVTIGSDGAYTYQTGKNSIETCTFTPAANINMTANYTNPHLYWTMRCDVFPFCEDLNTGATNSGLMIRVTDGSGNYEQWHVAGADTWDGSWRTFVLDLTNTANVHSTSGTLSLADVDIISFITDNSNSGNIRIIDNTWVDAVRYGDGLQAESTTTEAFDFLDIANDDVLTANYYGVLQPQAGILAAKGGIIIGDATGSATANLVSLNEQIVFQDFIVQSTHYKITAVASATATTDIDIQGAVWSFVGDGTLRPDVDWTDSDINSVVFQGTMLDMGTFKYKSGDDCRNITYVQCSTITPAGADIRGSTVSASNLPATIDVSAVVYNETADPDGEFDDMTFIRGSSIHHAIAFGTSSPTSITLRGIDFQGYNGTVGNASTALYFERTSGTVTVNLIGCTGTISYTTAGADINLVVDPVALTVTCVDANDLSVISGARVAVEVTSTAGGYPFETGVSVSVTSTTATVTHTAHGLSTNDYVRIKGLNQAGYNGVKQITVTGANTYTYTVVNDGAATGTPNATFVVISGTTNGSGVISATYSYSADQPISGRARKSTASPFYSTAPVTGTILAASGLATTVPMVKDEN